MTCYKKRVKGFFYGEIPAHLSQKWDGTGEMGTVRAVFAFFTLYYIEIS